MRCCRWQSAGQTMERRWKKEKGCRTKSMLVQLSCNLDSSTVVSVWNYVLLSVRLDFPWPESQLWKLQISECWMCLNSFLAFYQEMAVAVEYDWWDKYSCTFVGVKSNTFFFFFSSLWWWLWFGFIWLGFCCCWSFVFVWVWFCVGFLFVCVCWGFLFVCFSVYEYNNWYQKFWVKTWLLYAWILARLSPCFSLDSLD